LTRPGHDGSIPGSPMRCGGCWRFALTVFGAAEVADERCGRST
jgi:hypothetical protein